MSPTERDRLDRDSETLGRIVDWGVSVLLAVAGVLLGVLGWFLYLAADREAIARLVADGTLRADGLTDAQLVEVTYALAWWGGIGLAVLGLGMLAGGLAFLLYRRRMRRRREPGAGVDAVTAAVLGAVVTALTAFLPFSPVLGGGVAGYLRRRGRRAGTEAGALSGVVAALPLVVVFLFLIGGFAVATAELGVGFAGAVVGVALTVGLVVAVVYTVGLSALGGYLAVRLSERRNEPVTEEESSV